MAETPKVYVICDANCRWESMTKEQILTAIAQAVSTGEITDIDTGFVQTIKTINGIPLKFFVGTQATYEALAAEERINLYAIITDDTTREGIEKAIEQLQLDVKDIEQRVNGIEGKYFVWTGKNSLTTSTFGFNVPDLKNIVGTTFLAFEFSLQRFSTDADTDYTIVRSNPFKIPANGAQIFIPLGTYGSSGGYRTVVVRVEINPTYAQNISVKLSDNDYYWNKIYLTKIIAVT